MCTGVCSLVKMQAKFFHGKRHKNHHKPIVNWSSFLKTLVYIVYTSCPPPPHTKHKKLLQSEKRGNLLYKKKVILNLEASNHFHVFLEQLQWDLWMYHDANEQPWHMVGRLLVPPRRDSEGGRCWCLKNRNPMVAYGHMMVINHQGIRWTPLPTSTWGCKFVGKVRFFWTSLSFLSRFHYGFLLLPSPSPDSRWFKRKDALA